MKLIDGLGHLLYEYTLRAGAVQPGEKWTWGT